MVFLRPKRQPNLFRVVAMTMAKTLRPAADIATLMTYVDGSISDMSPEGKTNLNTRRTEPNLTAENIPTKVNQKRVVLSVICCIYLVLSSIFATTTLDIDEFTFIREPYEMLGGDYTLGYLRQHEYVSAIGTLARAYYFFWYYRPLNAPVIREDHRSMFENEEKKFGYIKPSSVQADDSTAVDKYRARLVVPEPDRFYTHGAGKPLLPALVSIPQMAFVKIFGITTDQILNAQYHHRYSAIFIVFRLVQVCCGLASVLLVFKILEKIVSLERAYLGMLIFSIFPISIKYFPNIHHDAVLVPFILLAVYFLIGNRYIFAGFAYGLALASKNVAIVLLPALVLDVLMSAFRMWRQEGPTNAQAFLRLRIFDLAKMGSIAFLTLLPFANPISYAQEILTPVIGRPIDPRGENVSRWTVNGLVGDDAPLSPQVIFVQKFLYFNDLGFLFFVLALFLAFQRPINPVSRLSLILFVIYLPISSIFGLSLGYRTLFLVPFFAMAASELLLVNQLRWLVVATAVLSLAYISNPSETDLIHTKKNIEQH